jgi:hypothetical protein
LATVNLSTNWNCRDAVGGGVKLGENGRLEIPAAAARKSMSLGRAHGSI